MVTHVVLFKFAEMAHAQEAVRRLLSMKGKVESLTNIQAGVDFTRSERSFEVALVTRHADRAALEAYRTDPVHLEVASYIKTHSTGAASVDFEE